MTQGDGMAEVTEADREAAIRAWAASNASHDKWTALARVFAEEREKARRAGYARGRIEELEMAAHMIAARPPLIRAYSNSRKAIAAGLRERARLIRESEETE